MIIIMKPGAEQGKIDKLVAELIEKGMQIQINKGTQYTVLGVLGDTASLDKQKYALYPGVDRVMAVQEPYKKASRKFHPEDSLIKVGDAVFGQSFTIIAGPCSVESEEQIIEIAKAVKAGGAHLLRGGAFKPRTSPYSFQGLEDSGLKLLERAKEVTGLPIVSEIMSPRLVERFDRSVDVIQIGARNMQNFDLLKELGKTRKPILLKRGLSSTIEEWLMSAEYILAGGNPNVILCERGIRTFETFTRNTLDISAIPAIKRLSHLPVIVDPSHATGMSWMVEPLSIAAAAAGADGVIIEVHNNPKAALCDGPQSVTPDYFARVVKRINAVLSVAGKGEEEVEE